MDAGRNLVGTTGTVGCREGDAEGDALGAPVEDGESLGGRLGETVGAAALGAALGMSDAAALGTALDAPAVGTVDGAALARHPKLSGGSRLRSHTVSTIQSREWDRRLCTPGRWAQPTPQLTTPTWTSSSGRRPGRTRGPPAATSGMARDMVEGQVLTHQESFRCVSRETMEGCLT